tara:strand:- start:1200 stop:1781 length:582 start_codon:yes stop_codon:yes gene_type:complete
MNELVITVKQARALCMVAPKNDVRAYLNGVHVDMKRNLLTVTDGHMLLRTKASIQSSKDSDGEYIVPRQTLYDIAKGGNASNDVALSFDGEVITLTRCNGVSAIAEPVGGTFPDYDRTIPGEVSGELAQFNHECLATCEKALIMCSGRKGLYPNLAHNGNAAAIMSAKGCESFAIIMPRRDSYPAEWVKWSES